MAKGKFAALQRLRPINWDISNDLLNSEDQEFKHREEQRIIADRRAKAKSEKDKKANQAHSKIQSFKLLDTGSESLNGTYADAIFGVSEEIHRLTDITLDKSGKYSSKERAAAQVKIGNLNNIPENFAVMANSVMTEKANYDKLLSEGRIFRDEEFESRFQNGFSGITLSFDDSGMPVGLFRKGNSDVNKDGIIDNYDVETMESLNNAYARPEFQSKYNYDSIVTEHAKRLQSAKNSEVKGVKTTSTTGVETDLLGKTVKRALYNADGSATELMKSFVREKGLDFNKLEDLKTIEAQYLNDVYVNTERGRKEDVDHSAAQGYQKLKDKKKEKDTTSNIQLMKTSKGDPVVLTEKEGVTWGMNEGVGFTVRKPHKVLIGDKEITIQKFYLDKDGKIYYRGLLKEKVLDETGLDDKTKTKTTELNGGGLNHEELNEVARAEGFEDAEQLRFALEQEYKSSMKKDKPSDEDKKSDYRKKYKY